MIEPHPWSLIKKITFRFFFIFFVLMTSIWNFIPVVGDWLGKFVYHPSFFVQNYILRLHAVPKWEHAPTGSGDTLDDWIMVITYFAIAVVGSGIWTALDRKHQQYERLQYWLSVGLRYYLAYVMLGYGIAKIFVQQMAYPSLAQFYTPLGDFTPMRFTWMFIGYSPPYQFISGLFETVAVIFILFRRTQLIGLLLFIGVMGNVVMLNFFYGVPVKYYSAFLWLIGLYLTAAHSKRLLDFLLFDRATEPVAPEMVFNKKWQRYTRVGLKVFFLAYGVGFSSYQTYSWSTLMNENPKLEFTGAFDVYEFKRNGIENNSPVDTVRWNQIVVGEGYEPGEGRGNFKRGTSDLSLATFTVDSVKNLTVKLRGDTSKLFYGKYAKETADRFRWKGMLKKDSVELLLVRNERKFRLATQSFKWVMENKDY